MTSAPDVSVLVTVFNRENYLRDCLNSILASTCRAFEVVVVDDASTDSSWTIASEYSAADPRIRAFKNESNVGDYPNRNRAASLARAAYIKFVDADDIIYPHSLDLMLSAMRRFPEAALGLSWSVIDPPKPFPFASSPRETQVAHYLGVSLLGVGPSASIIQRAAFDEVGGFSGRQFVGDSELWLRLTGRWPLVSLPPSLVWWRRHDDQQMSLEQSNLEILNTRFNLEKEFLEGSQLLDAVEKREAFKRITRRHTRRLMSLAIRDGNVAGAASLWKQSGIAVRESIEALLPMRGTNNRGA
jgi:glycosyltransferase involved in cell wall biosynthesis